MLYSILMYFVLVSLGYMYLLEKRFLTQGTVILSIYRILTLAYTNSKIEEKYFVYAAVSDNDAVQNPDEDEVILKPIKPYIQDPL
jgi:hypothetical protein